MEDAWDSQAEPDEGEETKRGGRKSKSRSEAAKGHGAAGQAPKTRKGKAPKGKQPKAKMSKQAMAERAAQELEYSVPKPISDEPLEIVEARLADIYTPSPPPPPGQSLAPLQPPALCQPIVYGSVAWWRGQKADDTSSHKWTVFVRGVDCEDLSFMIKHVVFTLHQSFDEPTRVVAQHPFEVTEVGWGEFDVHMQLHFVSPDEPPLNISHHLRLHPAEGQKPSPKRPVVSEVYDEVVFNRPQEAFAKTLLRSQSKIKDGCPSRHPLRDVLTDFSEAEDLKAVMAAQNYIAKEADALRRRFSALVREVGPLEESLPASAPQAKAKSGAHRKGAPGRKKKKKKSLWS